MMPGLMTPEKTTVKRQMHRCMSNTDRVSTQISAAEEQASTWDFDWVTAGTMESHLGN